ncbi:hypothetical protein OG912_05650 [Streptomyces sp. NBC_00464]
MGPCGGQVVLRHYAPETGRYASPDPLGLAPAPNPVGYVDNPNTASDPLGLMPKYAKAQKAQKAQKARDDALSAMDKVIEGPQAADCQVVQAEIRGHRP